MDTDKVVSVEQIDSVTNELYLLSNATGGRFVLKIIDESKRADTDIDHVLMSRNTTKFLRTLIRSIVSPSGKRVLLFDYLEGRMLSDIVAKGEAMPSDMYTQFKYFFAELALIKSRNFGPVNASFEAEYVSWTSFLESKLQQYTQALSSTPLFSSNWNSLLHEMLPSVDSIETTLVPGDVNLSNFLIGTGGELKVLDIGIYISGDSLLPYGLLMAHAWKTDLANAILNHHSEHAARLHFYACLEMLAILSFTSKNYPDRLDSVKPFGQSLPAISIFSDNLDLMVRLTKATHPMETLVVGPVQS
jgi:hypothetical protein